MHRGRSGVSIDAACRFSANHLAYSLFTAGCSAAQISFAVETGGEIQWMAASKIMGGSGGVGLLLSGLPSVSIAFAINYAIAFVITPKFYDIVEHVLDKIYDSFRRIYRLTQGKKIATEDYELLMSDDEEPPTPAQPKEQPVSTAKAVATTFTTLGAIFVVGLLQIVRPITPPYAHMSGSLPITLVEAVMFQPINSEYCLPHPIEMPLFPFERFTKFHGFTQTSDWYPASENCSMLHDSGPPPWRSHPPGTGPGYDADGQLSYTPAHGPIDAPPFPSGFPIWKDPRGPSGTDCQPLKLNNLNADIDNTIAAGLKSRKPKIKNVLLLTLESTRKDMFPLTKDGHPYATLKGLFPFDPKVTADLDSNLRDFTQTAAFLTGQRSGFEDEGEVIPKDGWQSLFKEGMGGVNVNGGVTQAAYTLKSLLSSHCGVESMAVDFAEEIRGHIYQPCLARIFEKMTSASHDAGLNKNNKAKDDYRSWLWESAMLQSVTDKFDSQDVLDAQMGFKNVIAESTISNVSSKHFPPKQPRVNYFGYPETETMPYLRDLFIDARKQNKRLFVSHLTSSPHHPFKTPKDWEGKSTWMNKRQYRRDTAFDNYMNTIKYQDEWIAQIFEMLHEEGALNETLVVMTGDHGLAFTSLDYSQSAVNNGHVSNFKIPILFVHPDLPRIQIDAKTTPLSIIPTVLDLLLQTDALPDPAVEIAKHILPRYQGHSLIRNLNYSTLNAATEPTPAFFKPFTFSAINPGGSLIAISDASTDFRLVLPLCSTIPLRFTSLTFDPSEGDALIAWTMDELVKLVKERYGSTAVEWARLAEELGRWWVWNQRAKWGYWGNARATGRGGGEIGGGVGRIKKDHWWETK
jgi:hypothetical protein